MREPRPSEPGLSRRDVLRLSAGLVGLTTGTALLAACGGAATPSPSPAPASSTAPPAPLTPTIVASAAPTTRPTLASQPAPTATTAPIAAGQPTQPPAQVVHPDGTPPSGLAGALTIGVGVDPGNLDPIKTFSTSNARWQSHVFSPLVWRDAALIVYDGQGGRPAPSAGFGLAESWRYRDDTTLEITLRRGVTFHNGEQLTAESVRSTFSRLLDKANASPQASNYAAIRALEAPDERTVIVRLSAVDPLLITKLAGYGAFITPVNAVKDTRFGGADAVGSGPYTIARYVKDQQLELEAWPDYWGARKPRIKRLTYRVIPDGNTRFAELMAGSVDIMALVASQAKAARENPNLSVVQVGSPTVAGLRLDVKQPPTDKLEVRRAIAHAIDLKTIIATIIDGFARPVGVWQSPFSFGFEDHPPHAYDPARAKQLLATAGLTTPARLTYDYIDGPQAKEIASAVKAMLAVVGFEVDLRPRAAAAYFSDYGAGKYGNLVAFAWGGWTLDYDNTYALLYRTGQTYNPSYSRPEVDRLLDAERATLDQGQRLAIAKQINRLLYDDVVDVALYQPVALWGVSRRVRNVVIPPDDRMWWLEAWV